MIYPNGCHKWTENPDILADVGYTYVNVDDAGTHAASSIMAISEGMEATIQTNRVRFWKAPVPKIFGESGKNSGSLLTIRGNYAIMQLKEVRR